MFNLERSVITLNARNHLNPSRPGDGQARPGDVVESIPFLARAAQMIGVIVPVDAGVIVGCNRIDGIIKILSHIDLPE